jgi:hypothetical protein
VSCRLVCAVAVAAGVSMVAGAATAAAPARAGLEPRQARLPASACSGDSVKRLVRRLVAAINSGDLDLVDELVAKGSAFKWYAVGGAPGRRLRAAALNRKTLLPYLAARHRLGERLRLVHLRFQGVSEGKYGNFNFDVVRSARDYPAKLVPGKGAVDCRLRPPRVAVWVIGK